MNEFDPDIVSALHRIIIVRFYRVPVIPRFCKFQLPGVFISPPEIRVFPPTVGIFSMIATDLPASVASIAALSPYRTNNHYIKGLFRRKLFLFVVVFVGSDKRDSDFLNRIFDGFKISLHSLHLPQRQHRYPLSLRY